MDDDYYIEDGRVVFSAAYHRRRGVCCGNGCRHCPFDHVNVPGATEVGTRADWEKKLP